MLRHSVVPLLLLIIPSLLVGCGDSSTKPSPTPTPPPAYAIERVFGQTHYLVGWAELDVSPDAGETLVTGRYHLPGDPNISRHEFAFDYASDPPVLDLDIGPAGGPFIETRVAGEGDGMGWCLGGWGELNYAHDIAEGADAPVYFDPRNPACHARLGLLWSAGPNEAELDLDLVFVADPQSPPARRPARLIHDGQAEDQSGIVTEAFRLVVASDTLHMKFMVDRFPTLYRMLWVGESLALTFWNDTPPNTDSQEFAPEFPDPADHPEYSVSEITTGGPAALAGSLYLPAGDGPFPGALLVADRRLADRNGGALLGHLAHELAVRGNCVLTCDKPGVGASPGDVDALDLATRRAALAEAWSYLMDHTPSSPERSIIIGHGEGALLALETAGADTPPAAGVIALACPLYDPDRLPDLPEAEATTGWLDLLGKSLFVDRHNELRGIDSADILGRAAGSVAFYYGVNDDEIAYQDFLDQVEMLDGAALQLTQQPFLDLNHYFTEERLDGPPRQDLVLEIVDWWESVGP